MTMTDDLERRLRAVESSRDPARGFGGATTCWHRNPDGPEAADEIARLRAENEALREALKPVADVDFLGPEPSYQDDDLVMISVGSVRRARAALKGSSHE